MTLTTKEKIARIERCLELWREIDEWPELDSVFMSGDGETDDDTEDYLNRCKAHLQMSSGVLPVIREAREKKSESIQDWVEAFRLWKAGTSTELVGPLAKIECEDPIAAALGWIK